MWEVEIKWWSSFSPCLFYSIISFSKVDLNKKRESEISKLRKDVEEANVQHEQAISSMRSKQQQALSEVQDELETTKKGKSKWVMGSFFLRFPQELSWEASLGHCFNLWLFCYLGPRKRKPVWSMKLTTSVKMWRNCKKLRYRMIIGNCSCLLVLFRSVSLFFIYLFPFFFLNLYWNFSLLSVFPIQGYAANQVFLSNL